MIVSRHLVKGKRAKCKYYRNSIVDKINSEFCFPFETIVHIMESKALYKGIILETAISPKNGLKTR